MRKAFLYVVAAFILLPVAPMVPASQPQNGMIRATRTEYEIVGRYPHDPGAYTQGLVWYKDGFYESTGLYGQSTLRRVEFPTGRVLKSLRLAPSLFAEGLAISNGKLIQLTWKSGLGFVYDLESFNLLREFHYDTEGWGLTSDGHFLIMSDGSSTLTYLDPDNFHPAKRLKVTMDGKSVEDLNELEFIEGEIWSNVWMSDVIVRINPASGQVTSYLDMSGLLPSRADRNSDDVLNGIAYDAETKRIFVGGKRWPFVFEIRPKRAR
jgi:glutaminyl-peptide cyclotransferase